MRNKIIYLESVSVKERQLVENFLRIWNDDSKTISIHTSGSTGIPKEILLNKTAMESSAIATGRYFRFKEGQKNILALSANYIAGIMQIVRSAVFDMQLIVAPVSSNPLKHLKDLSYDFAAFVPFQVQEILADRNSQKIYESISNVIIGGAPINNDLFNKISNLTNKSYATFGMTETVSHVALKEIKMNNVLYEALPNISFDVSQKKCLIVSAPNLLDTPIHTNDMIRLENQYSFEWLGRADFTINSGGIKIQPEVVERKIERLIDRVFYISKIHDELLGEMVVLLIEGHPFELKRMTSLKAELKKILGKYEMPKQILFQPTFKRTITGKIIRK